jgi:hypothetical protein
MGGGVPLSTDARARTGRMTMMSLRYVTLSLAVIAVAGCGGGGGGSGGSAADTTPPRLVATHPAAIDASVASSISFTFSERMTTSGATLRLMPSATVTGPYWSEDGRTAHWLPSAPLAYSTSYTALVSAQDWAGNALTGSVGFGFTTRDPPGVSFWPADGDVGVGSHALVVVTVEEPGYVSSVIATDGTTSFELGPQTGGMTNATFWHLSTPFDFGKTYTVSLVAGGTQTGEPLVPQTATFTTAPQPAVVSTDPSPDATGIPTSASLSITFNVKMDKASVQWGFSLNDFCKIRAWNSPLDTVFTCVFADGFLHPNATHSFTLDYTQRTGVRPTSAGGVAPGGLSYAGDALVPYTGRFSTVTTDSVRPWLAEISPNAAATGALPGGNITFTFSEAMDQLATQGGLTVQVTPDGGSPAVRTGTFSWNAGGTVMTYTPDTAFARGDSVAWSFAASSARDVAGNFLPAMSSWFHVVRQATQELPAALSRCGTVERQATSGIGGDSWTTSVNLALGRGSTVGVGDEGIDLGLLSASSGVLRAFWNFYLSGLTYPPVQVTSATLRYNVLSANGDPSSLGALYAYGVDFGSTLNASAFDVPWDSTVVCAPTCLPRYFRYEISGAAGFHSLDVTDKVLFDLARQATRGGRSQFEVEFATANNGDFTSDVLNLATDGTSSPTLTIVYDHAW